MDDRWTMDEVYEAAAKLMADGGREVRHGRGFLPRRYDNLMYMNGGSMVEKDGDSFKVAINSQANIDTLQTFVDKNNEGIMPKAIWAGRLHRQPRRLLQERRRGHVLLRFLELQCIHHGHHRL